MFESNKVKKQHMLKKSSAHED